MGERSPWHGHLRVSAACAAWIWLALAASPAFAASPTPSLARSPRDAERPVPAASDAARAPAGEATLPAGRRPGLARLATGLTLREQFDLGLGRSFFRDPWVTAPATTNLRDGLGPLFEAQSCTACHPDGGAARGSGGADGVPVGLVLRLARAGQERSRRAVPDPAYGDQLQRRASTPGMSGEGVPAVRWITATGRYAEGEEFELRRPVWSIADPAHGPLDPATVIAGRRAPSVVGAGLLDAIPEAAVLALADPEDRNGDGISGRPASVWDHARATSALGRFGWKAGQPSLRQQVAAAFHDDLGITSALFREESCTAKQSACLGAPSGADPSTGVEIDAPILDAVADFTAGLGVPARVRGGAGQAEIARGEAAFGAAGCAACHTPRQVTGPARFAALSGQTVWPYTDLLLHDMGEGLADGQSEFTASGAEWRTAPLWGVGRVARDPQRIGLLHDGRARTLAEAILWHGGEAQAARDRFAAAPRDERAALIAFLE